MGACELSPVIFGLQRTDTHKTTYFSQWYKLFKVGDLYSPKSLYEPFRTLDTLFVDKVTLYTELSVSSNNKFEGRQSIRNVDFLISYLTEGGNILSGKLTKLRAKNQCILAKLIRTTKKMALLSTVSKMVPQMC